MQEISASVLNLCVDFSYSFSAFSRRLLSFCFLERFFCAFLSRFNRFFNGFGALIFSPVSNVAKVAIPSQ